MARRRKNSSAISWWHDVKRDYTRFKKWNAKRVAANVKMAKERRAASAESAKARLESDALKAEKKRDAEKRRAARLEQTRARRVAAEKRAQSTSAKPQVVKARVVPQAATAAKTSGPDIARARAIQPGRVAEAAQSASAVLCGARTEDGTACQNPTTGGPCAAGHQPKGHRQTRKQGTARQGIPVRVVSTGDYWNTDQTVIYKDGKRQATVQTRTHDGLGRPLDEKGRRFFALRDAGYQGWIDQDGYAANSKGNRKAP